MGYGPIYSIDVPSLYLTRHCWKYEWLLYTLHPYLQAVLIDIWVWILNLGEQILSFEFCYALKQCYLASLLQSELMITLSVYWTHIQFDTISLVFSLDQSEHYIVGLIISKLNLMWSCGKRKAIICVFYIAQAALNIKLYYNVGKRNTYS